MRRRPLYVASFVVLFAGLSFPLLLRHAFSQEGYRLADSAAVQKLPDRQGGLMGMKTAAPRTVVLPDGTSIVVYLVEKIDVRQRPTFGHGDVLYAVNGVLFTSMDGMPRYVQSLPPGSTATVEILKAPPKRWRGRYVPLEQRTALSATVEIFSTPSKYARPPGPPPSPEQLERERLHIATMAAAGYATGTVIQAILNALGRGPDLAGPILAPSRIPPDTGLTPDQKSLLQNTDEPKKATPYGFDAPAVQPGCPWGWTRLRNKPEFLALLPLEVPWCKLWKSVAGPEAAEPSETRSREAVSRLPGRLARSSPHSGSEKTVWEA